MTTPATPIEFFYDIGSTYSYLAATQVAGIEERTGRKVLWRPFLLGGVFKATGNTAPATLAARASWLVRDAARWAEEYGVPLVIPSRFPLATLKTQRALVACERTAPEKLPALSLALFHTYWAEDGDPTSPETIARCARELGLDDASILAGTEDPAVKEQLKRTTDEAVNRGAFGAPTFFVDGEMWFGNDRIAQMERHLARRPA